MTEIKRKNRPDQRIFYRLARGNMWCFPMNAVHKKFRGGTPKFRTPLYPRRVFVCGLSEIPCRLWRRLLRSANQKNRIRGRGNDLANTPHTGSGVLHG